MTFFSSIFFNSSQKIDHSMLAFLCAENKCKIKSVKFCGISATRIHNFLLIVSFTSIPNQFGNISYIPLGRTQEAHCVHDESMSY